MPKRKKVVVIGGGTGSFTVLSGLKKHPLDLTAIVAMSDNGGSTGVLRDELGVLPPGDVRQCLVALSDSDILMRTLMNYRFPAGGLKGHSFGNLLLSALEKITGSFDSAVEKTGEILRIRGRVIPATLDKVQLAAVVGGKKIVGENAVSNASFARGLNSIFLQPKAKANPKALKALREADAIVLGPGNFYASLVPNLLVSGIPEAIRKSKAKKIYVCNLVNRARHTSGFTVRSFAATIEKYLGGSFDKVIYNNKSPDKRVLSKYTHEGESLVIADKILPKEKFLGANVVSGHGVKLEKSDVIKRALIRHDPDRLAKAIIKAASL